eukprot:g5633.t1
MSLQIPPVAAIPMTPRALSFGASSCDELEEFNGLSEKEEEEKTPEAASTAPLRRTGQQHQTQAAFCVLDSTQRIIGYTSSWAQKVGLVFLDEAGPKSQGPKSQFPISVFTAVGKNIREVVASDSAACPRALGEYLGSLDDLCRGRDLPQLPQDQVQDSQAAAATYYFNECAESCAEGQVIKFTDQFHPYSRSLYTGHTRVCWLIAAQDRKAKLFLLDLRDMTDQRRAGLIPVAHRLATTSKLVD